MSSKANRPMLACKAPATLEYPLWVSPKLDGVRCLTTDAGLVSRTLKPIRNEFTQSRFQDVPAGFDGELIVGASNASNVMQVTTSGVMTIADSPEVWLFLFDALPKYPNEPFESRRERVKVVAEAHPYVVAVPHKLVYTATDLQEAEEQSLATGYEGLMLRKPETPYKYGRSTVREGYLMKLKRFDTDEAEVIAVDELLTNTNTAETDERGYTKRSSAKEGKVNAGMLGAIQVQDLTTGIKFSIGTGFNKQDRIDLWRIKESLIGRIVTYRHFSASGVVTAPRFPVFVAFRDEEDM